MNLTDLYMAFNIVSLSLQLASAALIINFTIKREEIIKQFANRNSLYVDGNTKEIEYNHEAFKKEYEQLCLTRISFFYIVISIVLSIFGIDIKISKILVFLMILCFATAFYFLGNQLVKFLVKDIRKIVFCELTEDVQTIMSISDEEIDQICNKT